MRAMRSSSRRRPTSARSRSSAASARSSSRSAATQHGIRVDELERVLEQRDTPRAALAEVHLQRRRLPQPDRRRDGAHAARSARRFRASPRASRSSRTTLIGACASKANRLPTLKALDRAGEVLHVGTFSKLIAPGLRIGWIAARADWIARLMQLKSDGGSNPLIQRIVLDFCRSAAFPAHVERVQAAYREHRDRMVAALRASCPSCVWTCRKAATTCGSRCRKGVDGDELARRAAQVGVHIIAGSRFLRRRRQAASRPSQSHPPVVQLRLARGDRPGHPAAGAMSIANNWLRDAARLHRIPRRQQDVRRTHAGGGQPVLRGHARRVPDVPRPFGLGQDHGADDAGGIRSSRPPASCG